MPSPQTLKIYPGFNQTILNALEEEFPIPLQMVMVIDEMSIKERVSHESGSDLPEYLTKGKERGKVLANHAIPFMVRGLRTK